MLLTEEEREYLKQVLKPFDPLYIRKDITSDRTREFITVGMKDTDALIFPFFPRGKYYYGLQVGINYSMKDIGCEKATKREGVRGVHWIWPNKNPQTNKKP